MRNVPLHLSYVDVESQIIVLEFIDISFLLLQYKNINLHILVQQINKSIKMMELHLFTFDWATQLDPEYSDFHPSDINWLSIMLSPTLYKLYSSKLNLWAHSKLVVS